MRAFCARPAGWARPSRPGGPGGHGNEAHRLASADQLYPQIMPQGPLVLLDKGASPVRLPLPVKFKDIAILVLELADHFIAQGEKPDLPRPADHVGPLALDVPARRVIAREQTREILPELFLHQPLDLSVIAVAPV